MIKWEVYHRAEDDKYLVEEVTETDRSCKVICHDQPTAQKVVELATRAYWIGKMEMHERCQQAIDRIFREEI